MAEKGPDAASIEDFVRAAGVARGTFYNYFPTASDLLYALAARVAGELDGWLDRATAAIEDPAASLAAIMHIALEAFAGDPVRGWIAMQLAISRAPRQHALETRFAKIYRAGVASGRFHDVEIGAAWSLAFGTVRMAQRDLMAGDATSPVPAEQLVALVLAAYGVPFDEAQRISGSEGAAARSGQHYAPVM